MTRSAQVVDTLALILDHAAETLDASPRPSPPPQHWTVRNGPDIVRRSIAGDDADTSRARPSLTGFLSALAASFDEGVPVRSSAAGWVAHGEGVGSIGTSGFGKPPTSLTAREEYARAFAELERIARSLLPSKACRSGHVFSGAEQMAMWVECHGPGALSMHIIKGEVRTARAAKKAKRGKVVVVAKYEPPKVAVHMVAERHQTDATSISDRLAKGGIVATPHEIGLVCRGVGSMVEAAFVAKGWVRARRVTAAAKAEEAESIMAKAAGFDLIGWKDIAPVVEKSAETCRSYAERATDPLPVYDGLGGEVCAKRDEVLGWLARQVVPRVRRAS